MDHIFSGNNWSRIHSRLQVRLLLFLVLAIALVGFSIYEVAVGDMSWQVGLLALVIGAVLGYIYGRLIRVRWDTTEEKIVRQTDTIGIVILVLYFMFGYFREWLLGHFFTGAVLTAIALTLAGGILIGRFFGMHYTLMRTIREHRNG